MKKNKNVDKIRRRIEQLVDSVSMVVFLLFFLIGLYALLDIHAVNISAKMDEEIASLAPDADADVDLAELKKINPEIIAWVKIKDTNIDYPVVQAKNNTKYLTRNYRGDFATAGSIFLDYRNDGFDDDFSLIYGHRMDGQRMFGGISLFEQKDYFDKHKDGILYTEDGVYDLEISDFSVVDVDRTSIYNHDSNRNKRNSMVIHEVRSFAKQSRVVEYGDDDKIIVLSTCDKDSKHYRNVLLAKMIPRR
ncbi:class B sortase [Candidatus Saccharibacteria bacterium]|nr:class B sortase [Candidatus Saccharibacteria bacterium]